MPVSTRFAIDYPLGTEAPDIDGDMLKIVTGIENLAAQFGQGTLASRPVSTPGSPGKQGRFYVVTSGSETGQVHYDYGTGWIWINNIPTIGAGSITATELADNSVGSAEISADAVGDSELADNVVSALHLVNALKPSTGAGASAEALRALGMGAGLALSQAQIANVNRIGLLGARPAANTVVSGTQFFATDQVVEYISDGTTWYRTSTPAGATVDWFNTTAAAGWVLYDGSSIPASTGIYADLFTHMGSTQVTPDTKGKVIVGRNTADTDWDTIRETRGAKTVNIDHVHSTPDHAHGISSSPNYSAMGPVAPGGADFAIQSGTLSISSSMGAGGGGTSGAMNTNQNPSIVQPSIVACKMAKL